MSSKLVNNVINTGLTCEVVSHGRFTEDTLCVVDVSNVMGTAVSCVEHVRDTNNSSVAFASQSPCKYTQSLSLSITFCVVTLKVWMVSLLCSVLSQSP